MPDLPLGAFNPPKSVRDARKIAQDDATRKIGKDIKRVGVPATIKRVGGKVFRTSLDATQTVLDLWSRTWQAYLRVAEAPDLA